MLARGMGDESWRGGGIGREGGREEGEEELRVFLKNKCVKKGGRLVEQKGEKRRHEHMCVCV